MTGLWPHNLLYCVCNFNHSFVHVVLPDKNGTFLPRPSKVNCPSQHMTIGWIRMLLFSTYHNWPQVYMICVIDMSHTSNTFKRSIFLGACIIKYTNTCDMCD